MIKMPLSEHRNGLNTVKQQRRLLDLTFARLVAAAVLDGHKIEDLLADEPDAKQQQGFFDL